MPLTSQQPWISGAWTPTIAGSTTAGTNTYTHQTGIWRLYSNMLWVSWSVQMATKDVAMVGNVEVRGLPYASIAGNAQMSYAPTLIRIDNFTGLTGTQTEAYVYQGTNVIGLIQSSPTTGGFIGIIPVANLTATSRIGGSVLYPIA